MKKIRIALLCVCALFALVLLSSCGNTKINLNDYVKIDFDGYNSFGTATVTVDTEKLDRDYKGKILKAKQDTGVAAMFSGDAEENREIDASSVFNSCVEYELSKSSELSNGDTVTLKWKVDAERAEEKYGCEFKFSEMKVKVDELKKLKDFDPFDNITVEFNGMSGNGYPSVDIDWTDAAMYYVNFDYDSSSSLSNGDEFVITASVYDGEDAYVANNYGYKILEGEKTYTVEGLMAYLEDPKDLSDAKVEEIEEELQKRIKENYEDHEDDLSLTSAERVRMYVLSPEDSDSYYYNNNMLFVVYKIDSVIKKAEKVPETKVSYYWFARYSGIKVSPDGESDLDVDYYSTPSSWDDLTCYEVKAGNKTYSYSGCESITNLEKYFSEEYPEFKVVMAER